MGPGGRLVAVMSKDVNGTTFSTSRIAMVNHPKPWYAIAFEELNSARALKIKIESGKWKFFGTRKKL